MSSYVIYQVFFLLDLWKGRQTGESDKVLSQRKSWTHYLYYYGPTCNKVDSLIRTCFPQNYKVVQALAFIILESIIYSHSFHFYLHMENSKGTMPGYLPIRYSYPRLIKFNLFKCTHNLSPNFPYSPPIVSSQSNASRSSGEQQTLYVFSFLPIVSILVQDFLVPFFGLMYRFFSCPPTYHLPLP